MSNGLKLHSIYINNACIITRILLTTDHTCAHVCLYINRYKLMDPFSAVTVKEDNSKWNKKKKLKKKNKMILVRLNAIISILSLRTPRKNTGQNKKLKKTR